MNKHELMETLENSREQFLNVLDSFEDEELDRPNTLGEWSVKDLLTHLSMWEAQLITLLWQVRNGQKPTTVHFSGLSDDEINARMYRDGQGRVLHQALSDFHGVRNQTMRRLEEFSERDLIDMKRYTWFKGRSLAQVIAESTYEHEAEHLPALRELLAKLRSAG